MTVDVCEAVLLGGRAGLGLAVAEAGLECENVGLEIVELFLKIFRFPGVALSPSNVDVLRETLADLRVELLAESGLALDALVDFCGCEVVVDEVVDVVNLVEECLLLRQVETICLDDFLVTVVLALRPLDCAIPCRAIANVPL